MANGAWPLSCFSSVHTSIVYSTSGYGKAQYRKSLQYTYCTVSTYWYLVLVPKSKDPRPSSTPTPCQPATCTPDHGARSLHSYILTFLSLSWRSSAANIYIRRYYLYSTPEYKYCTSTSTVYKYSTAPACIVLVLVLVQVPLLFVPVQVTSCMEYDEWQVLSAGCTSTGGTRSVQYLYKYKDKYCTSLHFCCHVLVVAPANEFHALKCVMVGWWLTITVLCSSTVSSSITLSSVHLSNNTSILYEILTEEQ